MTIAADQHGLEIAIIGMVGRFPGAPTLAALWDNLCAGRDCITRFTDEELRAAGVDPQLIQNPNYVKARGGIEDAECFDANFFGLNPREAEVLDPQHRLLLEYSWAALENAGCDPAQYPGLIGVVAGVEMNNYLYVNLYSNPDVINAAGLFNTNLSNDKDTLATRIAYKLNLRGPAYTVQTACSTSLVAVHLACQSLLAGDSDIVLAGGVSVNFPFHNGYLYSDGMILSPDGCCRAFDAQAAGTVPGRGVGLVVLKRLADAVADRDTIHAVIKGSAINNDGADKVGYTAPSIDGQAQVIRAAQLRAGIDPETISYVEAHGTGTVLGDPIEVAALTQAFRASTQRRQFCALGSIKTNLGHCGAAAGVAGLIKTALALRHRRIPPSLHFRKPNPRIEFASSPFFVNADLREWDTNGHPRRAGVSSFGIGGTNAHVVLEEYSTPPGTARRRPRLLVVSARSPVELAASRQQLAEHLAAHPELNLTDVAETLRIGRRAFPCRSAVIAETCADAAARLAPAERESSTGTPPTGDRSCVFMFSGQGSQHLGMGRALYDECSAFRTEFDTCCQLFASHLGRDLRDLVFAAGAVSPQAEHELQQTALAQCALFSLEYALARQWQAFGVQPVALIGHSLGEYVAACLAGVFSLSDAVSVVAERGRLMQSMPPGAMLAVHLPVEEAEALLPVELEIAAVNAPSLTVISGPQPAIERFAKELEARGHDSRRLKTSHAFHSRLMDPAASQLEAVLRRVALSPPKIRYVSNLTGTWITPAQAQNPLYYARHLRSPVQFSAGLRELLQLPRTALLEVGPGVALATLARQQARGVSVPVIASMRHPSTAENDRAVLLAAVGQLWQAHVPVNLTAISDDEPGLRVPLPTYPFQRQRFYVEPRRGPRAASKPVVAGLARKNPDPARWCSVPVWRSTGPAQSFQPHAPAPDEVWLLFEDACLTPRLAHTGALPGRIIRVSAGDRFAQLDQQHYCLRAGESAEYRALIEQLNAAQCAPTHVLHAWSLDERTRSSSLATLAHSFYSVLYLAQALAAAPHAAPLRWSVLTSGVAAIGGDTDLQPANATLVGLCRVLPQEQAGWAFRLIDVEVKRDDDHALSELRAELQHPGRDPLVAHRWGRRWVQDYEPVTAASADATRPSALRPGGVYLITGGLGAVGLCCARFLARTVQARLVLASRHVPTAPSGSPSTNGSQLGLDTPVRILPADVTDRDALRAVVAQTIDEFGALHGVIHAAGLTRGPSFARFTELRAADCAAQFGPKLDGLIALADVLADVPVDFVSITSSLSAVLGGAGFAAYAAANASVDAWVEQRHRLGQRHWMSVNWDGWNLQRPSAEGDGKVSGSFADLSITAKEGEVVLQNLFAQRGTPQVVVCTTDLNTRLDQWVRRAATPIVRAAPTERQPHRYARPDSAGAYQAPQSATEHTIAEIWQDLLGLERVGVHDNFLELGGHSLLATQMLSRIRDRFSVRIPLASVFETGTVKALAERVESLQWTVRAPAAASGDQSQKREEIEL